MKRIGLAQIDGKWPNLALMKISAYYKFNDCDVSWFSPLERYDTVFASKIFDFTPDSSYLPPGTIRGGTGYGKLYLKRKLSARIEKYCPDYSIYPKFTAAMGFTTRGCIRKCPFCLVPEKEGNLTIVDPSLSFLSDRKELILLDNNLTAAPFEHFETVLNKLISLGVRVDFSQGLDIRLIENEHAKLLSKVKPMQTKSRNYKKIHFAWDSLGYEKAVRHGIEVLSKHIKLYRLMFYVLIGYNTTQEEDLYRVEVLRGLGVVPFVIPYNKQDQYQKSFARWVNHKAIFKSVKWEDYNRNLEKLNR